MTIRKRQRTMQAVQHHAIRRTRRKAVRRLAAASVVLAVTALCGFAVQRMSDARYFPVRSVRIAGELQHISAGALHAAVASELSKGFFALDMDAAVAAVRRLPWVDTVSLRRLWPDSVQITVVEQQPFAHWNNAGFLNVRGDFFAAKRSDVKTPLPHFNGAPGQEARVFAEYQGMNTLVHRVGLRIRSIVLDSRRAWRLSLNNGIELDLGRHEMRARLLRWTRFYPQVLALPPTLIRAVDLRYSNGFAVLWQKTPARARGARG